MKTSLLNRALIAFILMLTGLQLSAYFLSHGTLTGHLRDGDTHEPIPHTNVVLLQTSNKRLAATGTTDAHGNFHFRNVPIGRYIVQTTVLGYQPQQPTVALRPLRHRQQLGVLTLQSSVGQPTVRGTRQVVAQQARIWPLVLVPAV